jgi:hypothetical protein
MRKTHRSESVVVVALMGLFFLLGSADPSLAAALPFHPVDDGGAEDLTVNLALYDNAGLDPQVSSVMRSEIAAIFSQIGIAVEWVDTQALASGSGPAENSYLKVMLSVEPYRAWNLPEAAMGHAPGAEFPRPVVFVFSSRVREALKGGKRKTLALDPRNLGCALGRAVAHEIVHALTPEPFHTRSGLMRAAQDSQTLTSSQVNLDGKSVAELQRGLTALQELSLGSG